MTSTERIMSLVHTIAADPALLNRLNATAEADRGAVLAEIGYGDVSPEDVAGSAHLFAASSVEEIDEDQLAGVAGGGTAEITPTVPMGAASASAAT